MSEKITKREINFITNSDRLVIGINEQTYRQIFECKTAIKLIENKKSDSENFLSLFNYDLVKRVKEEIFFLETWDIDDSIKKTLISRNNRCLLAYIYKRIEQIRIKFVQNDYYLNEEIKMNMSEEEIDFIKKYQKMLYTYMKSIR